MRTALLVAALLMIVALAMTWSRGSSRRTAPPSGEMVTLRVGGMVCGACVLRVENVATRLEGVTRASVDREQGHVEVAYDPERTNPAVIAGVITEAGFQAEVSQ